MLMSFNVTAIEPFFDFGDDTVCDMCEIAKGSLGDFFDKVKNKDRFSNYKQDDDFCENKNKEKGQNYNLCKDGSISFPQPDSWGFKGYEGYCGQTSIANLYKMYCGQSIDVNFIKKMTAKDITPGIRPGTFLNSVNSLFLANRLFYNSECPSGIFEMQKPKTEKEFISSVTSAVHQYVGPNQLERKNHNGQIRKRAPVSLLLRLPSGKGLHWVTVVDVEFKSNKCEMVINHWGRQDVIPCKTVAKWSRGVGSHYKPLLNKYTMISFRK